MFPSSDPSVGDRIDHVNVAHHLFCAWNAAHVLAKHAGFKCPRAYETKTISRRPTKPDTQVSVEASYSIQRETAKGAYGTLTTNFRDAFGAILCEIETKFVAQRR